MAAKKDDKKAKTPAATSEVQIPKEAIQKAFAIERQSNGKWIMHIYDVYDGKILGVKSTEAEPKSLAVERFKIQFVQHYILGKN